MNRRLGRQAGVSVLSLVIAGAVCVALLSACGAGTSRSGSASPTSATVSVPAGETPAAVTSAGTPPAVVSAPACPRPKPHAAGSTDVTIDGDRKYILHVPRSYDGTRQLPLVINLHGAGSNAIQQAFYSGFQTKADREGFVTVTPDAEGSPQAWNFIPLPSLVDDVGFIRDILDRTQADLCIDPSRVYSTGISSGAAMSVRLACSLSDRIAAIGVVSAMWNPPNCPADHMPVLEFHGTADPVVPFAGGNVATSGIPSPAVETAMAGWAKQDACGAQAATAQFSQHIRTETWSGCRDGARVQLFAIDGGGHTWPGASVEVPALGATTHEVNATDQIWQFFAAHPKQAASR